MIQVFSVDQRTDIESPALLSFPVSRTLLLSYKLVWLFLRIGVVEILLINIFWSAIYTGLGDKHVVFIFKW